MKNTSRAARAEAMAATDGWVVDKNGAFIIVPEVLAYFEKAIEENGALVEDFCYLGEIYARMEKLQESNTIFMEATKLYPDDWLVPYYWALADRWAGKLEDALQKLKRASELAPCRSDPVWKMGHIYGELGNIEMADIMQKQSKEIAARRKAITEAGLVLA